MLCYERPPPPPPSIEHSTGPRSQRWSSSNCPFDCSLAGVALELCCEDPHLPILASIGHQMERRVRLQGPQRAHVAPPPADAKHRLVHCREGKGRGCGRRGAEVWHEGGGRGRERGCPRGRATGARPPTNLRAGASCGCSCHRSSQPPSHPPWDAWPARSRESSRAHRHATPPPATPPTHPGTRCQQ